MPERPDGTRPPSAKELQKEICVAHHECTQRRQALQVDVDSAESGDVALISAATVLMVLGKAADGSNFDSLSHPTTDRIEAVPPVQPSKRLATETRAVAEERVREINTSLDEYPIVPERQPRPRQRVRRRQHDLDRAHDDPPGALPADECIVESSGPGRTVRVVHCIERTKVTTADGLVRH